MQYKDLISGNFLLHSFLLPSLTPGMNVVKSGNLTFVDSNLTCDSFNIVYLTKGHDVSFEEIKSAADYFRRKGLPFCVWVEESNFSETLKRFIPKLDLNESGTDAGMYLMLNDYQPDNCTGDIRQVLTNDQITEFADVTAHNWSPPDEHIIKFYTQAAATILSKKTGIELFIYYMDERPVAGIEIFLTDASTAGLYSLSTLEPFRRRGIGTMLMKFALNRLKDLGFSTVVLAASPDGLGLYKKLGFQTATNFHEFK